eukprot:13893617-Alexandrium_andersonii.AAC.1
MNHYRLRVDNQPARTSYRRIPDVQIVPLSTRGPCTLNAVPRAFGPRPTDPPKTSTTDQGPRGESMKTNCGPGLRPPLLGN